MACCLFNSLTAIDANGTKISPRPQIHCTNITSHSPPSGGKVLMGDELIVLMVGGAEEWNEPSSVANAFSKS